ncbi:MAG: UvrD-helicase domain-containing protein [Anaeromyxobacteraceae bacterium]
MTATRPKAPDHEDRERAIRARGVNVLVDAGAGTGKTTLLVRRILDLVAPEHGAATVPLRRIAAITFTRKAAGELKYRLREALLGALADRPAGERRRLLEAAVAELDTAWVGTIHGFADRLLRMRPVEARLSPTYDVVEEGDALLEETFDLVMQAVELGTLAADLGRPDLAPLARELEGAVVDALEAGFRPRTVEYEYFTIVGLDGLFRRFVETRDVKVDVPPPPAPDLGLFRKLAGEYLRLAEDSAGELPGSVYVRHVAERLAKVRDEKDPIRILGELVRLQLAKPKDMVKKRAFVDDDAGWEAWQAWNADDGLRDRIAAPFHAWLARRLVRCAPVVTAAHDLVKRRHRAVDQVDLLLQLRDLLRANRGVRRDLQQLFDQLLVDEFQDTDPLQAEIVLYLCEAGANADTWQDVALTPGKLTIVGDPKQSIYRFRRADISVYAAVRELVRKGPHLEASLRANFRCAPALIDWLNDRFDHILGKATAGTPAFDARQGTVVNVPLLAGRQAAGTPRVVTIPLGAPEEKVDLFRAAEAGAVAAFLRALVDRRERRIVDPVTGEERPVRLGDVAILTAATTKLPLLFPELDRLGIPYAVRGSRLFLEDALHRQFLLALRHLADPADGVAKAALFRAPFFAIDLDDAARERAGAADQGHPGALRVREAKALLQELRRDRLDRAPGDTARDLLERTAFARTVALGANGVQRLAGLRELCLRLDALAADEGLDFDGATQRMREWVIDPVELDPPRPVGEEAVQILSIHQAKGLEFPVVLLWDACASVKAQGERAAFVVDRDGTSWSARLGDLEWSEPEGSAFAAREQAYRDAERLRLVYVAATRARDLLVVPVPVARKREKWVSGLLVEGAPSRLVDPLEPYALDAVPAWANGVAAPRPARPGDAAPLAADVAARWTAASAAAGAPRLAPSSVTAEAHREPDGEEETRAPKVLRQSRHGPVFGDTVHRAIGLALAAPARSPADAVARAVLATGLDRLHAEAADDVARALAALEAAGLRRAPGVDLRLEYPVALATPDGAKLVQGYVDLVGLRAATGRLAVVDFKTDQPPGPGERVEDTHAAYVAQVQAYARTLEALGLAPAGSVEAGLLFTADGVFRWV